uniref:Uncharacterized protein n=1 Tax=Arundo donax TaxID=35708 RepID=A0A0A9BFM5_ARUDO
MWLLKYFKFINSFDTARQISWTFNKPALNALIIMLS